MEVFTMGQVVKEGVFQEVAFDLKPGGHRSQLYESEKVYECVKVSVSTSDTYTKKQAWRQEITFPVHSRPRLSDVVTEGKILGARRKQGPSLYCSVGHAKELHQNTFSLPTVVLA